MTPGRGRHYSYPFSGFCTDFPDMDVIALASFPASVLTFRIWASLLLPLFRLLY